MSDATIQLGQKQAARDRIAIEAKQHPCLYASVVDVSKEIVRREVMRPFSPLKWAAIAVVFLMLSGCDKVLSHKRTVCVTGYNEYERQIYEFWLDNESKSGCFGNPSGREDKYNFGGGGGFACGCTVTPGKKVSLYWSFEQTRAEFDAKEPPEEHTVQVTIPQPESRNSRYLRVYFMKDGSTPLQWVDDMGAPELPPSAGKHKQ